jgi:hypothetical protein
MRRLPVTKFWNYLPGIILKFINFIFRADKPGSIYIWPVLPPMLAERIRRHYHVLYGNRFTSANAFAQFWSEFIADDAFRKRIETKARELQPIVFDSQDRSWGLWPIDPEECAGIGFLLGLSLEEIANLRAGLRLRASIESWCVLF